MSALDDAKFCFTLDKKSQMKRCVDSRNVPINYHFPRSVRGELDKFIKAGGKKEEKKSIVDMLNAPSDVGGDSGGGIGTGTIITVAIIGLLVIGLVLWFFVFRKK